MPLALKEKLSSWLWQLLEHRVIAPVQPVDILLPEGGIRESVLAAVDTQSEFSSIDRAFAKELGLQVIDSGEEIEFVQHGRSKLAPIANVTFRINGQVKTGRWAVISRTQEKNVVSLGKADLAGFLIDVPEDRTPAEEL